MAMAVVVADAGSRMPVGTALFSYSNANGVLVSQAGVGLWIPSEQDGFSSTKREPRRLLHLLRGALTQAFDFRLIQG